MLVDMAAETGAKLWASQDVPVTYRYARVTDLVSTGSDLDAHEFTFRQVANMRPSSMKLFPRWNRGLWTNNPISETDDHYILTIFSITCGSMNQNVNMRLWKMNAFDDSEARSTVMNKIARLPLCFTERNRRLVQAQRARHGMKSLDYLHFSDVDLIHDLLGLVDDLVANDLVVSLPHCGCNFDGFVIEDHGKKIPLSSREVAQVASVIGTAPDSGSCAIASAFGCRDESASLFFSRGFAHEYMGRAETWNVAGRWELENFTSASCGMFDTYLTMNEPALTALGFWIKGLQRPYISQNRSGVYPSAIGVDVRRRVRRLSDEEGKPPPCLNVLEGLWVL